MTSLLELRNIHKRYDSGTVALKDMSLVVGEHEFVSLLGPSGCGKSTALKMIAGLSSITSGSIAWSGGGADHAHDMSFVFQEPTLMPWATVFDNTLLLWHSARFTVLFVTHSVYEAVYLSRRIVIMAARPGRVVTVIDVDEPYPRSDAFRATPRYNELCVRVSKALVAAGEQSE